MPSEQTMTSIASNVADENFLEKAVSKVARSPRATQHLARKKLADAKRKNPSATDLDIKKAAGRAIVRHHVLRSGVVGGGTGLIGAVPGVGTAAAISAGVTADMILQMKISVDMCHALVYLFKPEMGEEEAYSLAVTLATYGMLERNGVRKLAGKGMKFASRAGVKILRQQLKGTALIATKQAFKRVGIVFTRKAVEKAIPFGVGAVIGSTVNAGITTYVGREALKWLELDADLA